MNPPAILFIIYKLRLKSKEEVDVKNLVWAEIVNPNTINLLFDQEVSLGEDLSLDLKVSGKNMDYILAMDSPSSKHVKMVLEADISLSEMKEVIINRNEKEYRVCPISVLENFTPEGDLELGCIYGEDSTTFRTWSPIAKDVKLLLFEDFQSEDPDVVVDMEEIENGVWETKVEGDLDGWFYKYEIKRCGATVRTVDIYSKSVSINGEKSAVVDLKKSNPEGWEEDILPALDSPTDAVIYEVHVADITAFDDEIPEELRGKFLGIVAGGKATKHLKELGVTHVQLMPSMIFRSCKEDDEQCYNWGYDPYLHMVPSGKYSKDPYNPYSRISELKELILKLHKMGIRVILDMVFPHTFDIGEKSPLDATVPYYYYRISQDGKYVDETGCGNTTATERKMMRKLVIDTLKYWVNEYHVDGFRFDQMGAMDKGLVEDLTKRLKKVKPSVLIYGEPWGAGTTRIFKGDQRGKNYGVFNDDIRDAIRGSVFEEEKKGFVMAEKGTERRIAVGFLGSPSYLGGFTLKPEETVNYSECHDNHTLWDKNLLSAKKDSRKWNKEDLKKAQKLAGGITILSLGIPFLHLGQDFCRTKNFNPNSYNAPIDTNGVNWRRKEEFSDVFEYYKGLIKLRRKHPAFRANDPDEIREKAKLLRIEPLFAVLYFGYHLNEDPWKEIFIILNGSLDRKKYHLPSGIWKLVVDSKTISTDAIRNVENLITVEPISMNILWR